MGRVPSFTDRDGRNSSSSSRTFVETTSLKTPHGIVTINVRCRDCTGINMRNNEHGAKHSDFPDNDFKKEMSSTTKPLLLRSSLPRNNHKPTFKTWNSKRKPNQTSRNNSFSETLSNPVTDFLQFDQEAIWNEFTRCVLDPLFFHGGLEWFHHLKQECLQVLKGLFHMGIILPVLESAAHVIADATAVGATSVRSSGEPILLDHGHQYDNYHHEKRLNHVFPQLARFLAYGVTRDPTPIGVSQRLALLHVICTFREQFYYTRKNANSPHQEELSRQFYGCHENVDARALWLFLMGDKMNVKEHEDEPHLFPWQTGGNPFYLWCWELRALTLYYLAREEQERQAVLTLADHLADMLSLTAISVEISLNRSTQLVCQSMEDASEWIKSKWVPPAVKSQDLSPHFSEDREVGYDVDDDENASDASSSTLTSVSLASVTGAVNVDTAKAPSASSTDTIHSNPIGVESYVAISRTARKATDAVFEISQSCATQWQEISGDGFRQVAESGREWAAENVDPNTQHWAYVDAASKVGLAGLGAMLVMGDAVYRNTQVLLDHSTSVMTNLVQHRFGLTAANLFEDVSRSTTNVWRTTAQLVSLVSPTIFFRALVKHSSQHHQEREQTIRRQVAEFHGLSELDEGESMEIDSS